MTRHKRIIYLTLFKICFTSCLEEQEFAPTPEKVSSLIYLNNEAAVYDDDLSLMLYPISDFNQFEAQINHSDEYDVFINDEYVENNNSLNFEACDCKTEYSVKLEYSPSKVKNYSLQFTTLPIIEVDYNYKKILDEPKGPACISLISNLNNYSKECCGIETRGCTANRRPKKSFGFEIWEDYDLRIEKDTSLLDMYVDDDWILDAVYNDPSRVRNRVSFDVWALIQKDALERQNDVLYSSIDGKYIELFLNNNYQGLYCLSERIEGKMLGITKQQSGTQGFLYKSEGWSDANRLIECPDTTVDAYNKWSDWEQKLPATEDGTIWKPLYNFIDFVANSSDEQFRSEINHYLVLDQTIDFYILINLIYGTDNVGKNYLLATKSSKSPFYIIPWDMDATWGRNYRGEETKSDDAVSFYLFERLIELNPDNFNQRLKDRYSELRQEVISEPTLNALFENYAKTLVESGANDRNNSAWPDEKSDLYQETEYISSWLKNHIIFLDNYIDEIGSNQNLNK